MENSSILKLYSQPLYLEHSDYEKCGQCWYEKIKHDLAKEYIKSGKTSQEDTTAFFEEASKLWAKTGLYKEVKAMLSTGLTIKEVSKIMSEKGIEI